MSGSSEAYSAETMAEQQHSSQRNRDASNNAVRALAGKHTGAVRREHETYTPVRKTAPVAFGVKLVTQKDLRAAEDARIAAIRAVTPVTTSVNVSASRRPSRDLVLAETPMTAEPQSFTAGDAYQPAAMFYLREARIQQFCTAAREAANQQENLLAYTYIREDETEVSSAAESQAFVPIAVDLIRRGAREVRVSRGVILTVIHKRTTRDGLTGRENTESFAVVRTWFADAEKAIARGEAYLVQGVSRTRACRACQGIGRVYIGGEKVSRVCDSCAKPCKCPTLDANMNCARCRNEGVRGTGIVPAAPLEVHSYTVKRGLFRANEGGLRDIPGGVLAQDRPLSRDPEVKSREKTVMHVNRPNAAWESKASQTRVSFSRG